MRTFLTLTALCLTAFLMGCQNGQSSSNSAASPGMVSECGPTCTKPCCAEGAKNCGPDCTKPSCADGAKKCGPDSTKPCCAADAGACCGEGGA